MPSTRAAARCEALVTVIAAPVGALTLAASTRGLAAVSWAGDEPARVPLTIVGSDPAHPVLRETARQPDASFAGRRRVSDLPQDVRGTDVQKRVWAELLRIPYGETRSDGRIARALGDPNLMRAVGAANGRNPISIVAPCHRVVGAAGQLRVPTTISASAPATSPEGEQRAIEALIAVGALTGFAGGLAAKAYLLALKGRDRDRTCSGRPRPHKAVSGAPLDIGRFRRSARHRPLPTSAQPGSSSGPAASELARRTAGGAPRSRRCPAGVHRGVGNPFAGEKPQPRRDASGPASGSYPMFSFTFSTSPFSENGFARKS